MSYTVTEIDGNCGGNGEKGGKEVWKSHVGGFECTWPAIKVRDFTAVAVTSRSTVQQYQYHTTISREKV